MKTAVRREFPDTKHWVLFSFYSVNISESSEFGTQETLRGRQELEKIQSKNFVFFAVTSDGSEDGGTLWFANDNRITSKISRN